MQLQNEGIGPWLRASHAPVHPCKGSGAHGVCAAGKGTLPDLGAFLRALSNGLNVVDLFGALVPGKHGFVAG